MQMQGRREPRRIKPSISLTLGHRTKRLLSSAIRRVCDSPEGASEQCLNRHADTAPRRRADAALARPRAAYCSQRRAAAFRRQIHVRQCQPPGAPSALLGRPRRRPKADHPDQRQEMGAQSLLPLGRIAAFSATSHGCLVSCQTSIGPPIETISSKSSSSGMGCPASSSTACQVRPCAVQNSRNAPGCSTQCAGRPRCASLCRWVSAQAT